VADSLEYALYVVSIGAGAMFDRITFDPNILGGRACIRGIRITVAHVVNLVANGMTAKEILAEYPDLEAEDIRQALQYAAYLAREETYPLKEAHG
jgi:uncharacterized protein (DUF433 family)